MAFSYLMYEYQNWMTTKEKSYLLFTISKLFTNNYYYMNYCILPCGGSRGLSTYILVMVHTVVSDNS